MPLIRQLLGLPAPGRAAEEEDAAEAQLRRSCPVCQVGLLVATTWPRPTIAQIMQWPLDQLRQYRPPFQ